MNESEKAQAIDEVKKWGESIRIDVRTLNRYQLENQAIESGNKITLALEIVDSQAQKISEQTTEIERLSACMFQHMSSETYNHCQKYLEKMRGNDEKAN